MSWSREDEVDYLWSLIDKVSEEKAALEERLLDAATLINELDMDRIEQDDLILGLLLQGTGGTTDYDGEEAVDNMCMSVYEDACEYLEKRGLLQQINTRFYRIVREESKS